MALSYSQGIGTTRLLGETIGANFDRAVAAFPERDALIVRHQDVRLTYGELGENVDTTARALQGSACARATASGSGPRTARSGSTSSSRPRSSA